MSDKRKRKSEQKDSCPPLRDDYMNLSKTSDSHLGLQLLSLPNGIEFPGENKSSIMITRSFYNKLFNVIINDWEGDSESESEGDSENESEGSLIIGQPGIGKSWFAFYVTMKLIQGGNVNVVHFRNGLYYIYIVDNYKFNNAELNQLHLNGGPYQMLGEQRFVIKDAIFTLLRDRSTFYIEDVVGGVVPTITSNCYSLIITTPNIESDRMKGYDKRFKKNFYFPAWSKDELFNLRALLMKDEKFESHPMIKEGILYPKNGNEKVSLKNDNLFNLFYEIFGCNLRAYDIERDKKSLNGINESLEGINTENINNAIHVYRTGNNSIATHQIFELVADDEFGKGGLEIISFAILLY